MSSIYMSNPESNSEIDDIDVHDIDVNDSERYDGNVAGSGKMFSPIMFNEYMNSRTSNYRMNDSDKKIGRVVDIYNLDNIETINNNIRIKIYIEKGELSKMLVNGESYKETSYKYTGPKNNLNIKLDDILKQNECIGNVACVKFKIHNLTGHIRVPSYLFDIYDEQIFFSELHSSFSIVYKQFGPGESGNIEIIFRFTNTHDIDIQNNCTTYQPYPTTLEKCERIIRHLWDYDFNHFDIHAEFFKNYEQHTNDECYKSSYRIIKKIEIPVIVYTTGSTQHIGTLIIECYRCRVQFYTFIVSNILFNGDNINMLQEKSCSCREYQLYSCMKSKSNLYNRLKMCGCFQQQLNEKFDRINKVSFSRDIFIEKLGLVDGMIHYTKLII